MRERNPTYFREYAGVLCAFILAMEFGAIGFMQIGLTIWRGVPVTIPGDWMAAMLSLASASLGYLVGKQQVGGTQTVPAIQPDADSTITVTPPPQADPQ